jgi:virginiamycin B lyase
MWFNLMTLPGRSVQIRGNRRFSPRLDSLLESRHLLSSVPTSSSVSAVAFDPAVTLPHQQPGTTFDMMVPGAHLGSTHEITLGPDGNLWFTQQLQNEVGRLTPSGQFTLWSTGDNSGPHGIEFDKQGRLWITRQFSNTISQVVLKSDGTIQLINHDIPFPDASPHGLTVGTGGRVWFTGREGNVVGYYDPKTNAFRVFKLADPDPSTDPEQNGNFPIYIKQAPDGSMYFTNLLTSQVSRITQSGKITQFPLPSTFGPPNNARPIAVYIKDNGVVVVTEESGHAYAYIQKNGSVTEKPLAPIDSEAASLTYDRLGTLWIQYNTPDLIARVNADGSITTFPIPTMDAVQHRITIGPDGELWYTELKADKIGRMVTGNADGPAIDGVASQSYTGVANGTTGLDDQAFFAQGKNTYNAHYTLTVSGPATALDRQNSIVHFVRNLQGDINRSKQSVSQRNAQGKSAPIYGLQQPAYTADGLTSSFKIKNGLVTFTQTETIDQAVYTSTLTMKVGHNTGKAGSTTNLSSAVAHFLEAVEVESGGGGVI